MIYDELEKRNYFLNARCARVNPKYELDNVEFMMQKDWHSFNKRKDRISNLFNRDQTRKLRQIQEDIFEISEESVDLLEELFNSIE